MILAAVAGDFLAITILIIIVGCALGGIVKFSRALKILRQGRPAIDPALAEEQEKEREHLEREQPSPRSTSE